MALPSEGRSGKPPKWPLTASEPDVWADLWRTPQAVAWERLGWTRTVARYAFVLGLCENPDTLSAALLSEARQMEDRLGLSPMSMLRLRWEIVADEVGEVREDKKRAKRPPLRVVAKEFQQEAQ
jgi:hypothetical protein